MPPIVNRLAPTVIVAAFVAWCVWPYLSGEGSGGLVQEPAQVPQIAGSLLQPTIEPAGDRNPFRPANAGEPDPSETATIHEDELASAPVEQGLVPEVQPGDVLEQLTLDGTFIYGGQRLALINGRVYAEGDTLTVSGLTTEPCIVKQIFAHKVLIEFRGETLELPYRDSMSKAARPRSADALDQADPTGTKAVVPGSEGS